MEFEWYVIAKYYPLLVSGLIVTIKFTLIALVTSVIFGLLIAVLRALNIPVLRKVLDGYVVVFRETPLLVQLYFVYYALPEIGVVLSAASSGILAVTLNEGAFIAEIVRGGILGIHKGQNEAATALALTKIQTLRHIIFPQAIRNVIPSLVGHSSYILKDTALLSVVAVEELTNSASYINDLALSPLTTFGSAAVLYVIFFWIFQFAGNAIENMLSMEAQTKWT